RAARVSGKPALIVQDNGPGVPEADRRRIFDRFVRLEAHRGKPGSGLGLSLVRAVAAMHSAEIKADDARPGLRITLALPTAEPATARPAAKATARAAE
ncbi:MAG: sensor histidine kinase, partial [Alphaproteobacteria bacterium]